MKIYIIITIKKIENTSKASQRSKFVQIFTFSGCVTWFHSSRLKNELSFKLKVKNVLYPFQSECIFTMYFLL